MNKAQSVDEYIESAPENVQDRLIKLRKTIRNAVPDAEEKISYAIPYYHYKGRLVYFAYTKKHIGVYAITSPVLQKFKSELEGFVQSKGTIQFPYNKPLPFDLVEKIVKTQAKLFSEKDEPKR